MAGVALSREAFHGLQDLRREKVELPQRGGYVFVREMCADEILDFADRMKSDQRAATTWLMVRSIVDESGNRMFSDDESDMLSTSLNREEFMDIQARLLSLNGLGEETEKK